jgi:protein-disulfide isomerase
MANANEVGLGLAVLGIAAGFAAGVFAGRSAAQRVEEDSARFAAASAELRSVQRSMFAREPAAAETADVARYKIAVTSAQPSMGPSDALVTIVEWCALYGEVCRRTDALLTAALERHPFEVRRVYRSLCGSAPADARALEVARAAHEQGKFWELRKRLSGHDGAPSLAQLRAHATAIGMDWAEVERALERRTHNGVLATDRALARSLDVMGAAALHVNGRPITGELTEDELSALIDEEIARARLMMNDGASRERIYAEIIKPAAWRPFPSSL